MLCSILFTIGLTMASCVEPTPPRDQAAEVLMEQAEREKAEFEEMKAKRAKLYSRMGECSDCGKLNTLPFGRE